MSIKELILYIENHGISLIFMLSLGIIAWRHAIPYFKETTKTLTEIRKYFEYQNHNLVAGKGLETLLRLKIQEMRWSLQKKILDYIIHNNISKNWNIITRELSIKIAEKKEDLYIDLRDFVNKSTLKLFTAALDKELEWTEKLIIELLEDLKNHGKEDENLYEVAKRSVENHFEHFENRMFQQIKDILE